MSAAIPCTEPDCENVLLADPRHFDNLTSTEYLCPKHSRENREIQHPKTNETKEKMK